MLGTFSWAKLQLPNVDRITEGGYGATSSVARGDAGVYIRAGNDTLWALVPATQNQRFKGLSLGVGDDSYAGWVGGATNDAAPAVLFAGNAATGESRIVKTDSFQPTVVAVGKYSPDASQKEWMNLEAAPKYVVLAHGTEFGRRATQAFRL